MMKDGAADADRRARQALRYAQALERAAAEGELYARACALCGGWPPEGEAALRERLRVHAKTLTAAFPDPGPLRPKRVPRSPGLGRA